MEEVSSCLFCMLEPKHACPHPSSAHRQDGAKKLGSIGDLIVVMGGSNDGGAFGGLAYNALVGLWGSFGDFEEVPRDCKEIPGVTRRSNRSPGKASATSHYLPSFAGCHHEHWTWLLDVALSRSRKGSIDYPPSSQ